MRYDDLRQMIQSLVANFQPSNINDAAPCTVADMKNLVNEISFVLNAFVDELQNELEPETVPDD